MPSERDIRDVVNAIIDPCSIAARTPIGLDDMGLVGNIDIREGPGGAVVSLSIGTTHPFCMMAAMFMHEAQQRVSALPGVALVEVSLDHRVLWTPDRMKPEFRERMARGGTATGLQSSSCVA